jgi:glycosyltransferase involved in cell wall biosynthesis
VLTYNEERNLPICLQSLEGLPCEVFVVDSGSTDKTVHIATEWGARVVQHPFENYASQRNWAQQNLPIQTEWVLHLDADERLTPQLVNEIKDVLRSPPDGVDGFLLRKRTFFMGRWIRHGGHYPSYHLRLFRKNHGFCENRLYDQHFIVKGEMAKLRHDYIDVVASDLATWSLRHVRWAGLEAIELQQPLRSEGRLEPRLLGTPVERRRWLRANLYARSPMFIRAFGYWLYRYFIRLGFLDGTQGLIFHFLQGCWYRFLTDARIYEARLQQGKAPLPEKPQTTASKSRENN